MFRVDDVLACINLDISKGKCGPCLERMINSDVK